MFERDIDRLNTQQELEKKFAKHYENSILLNAAEQDIFSYVDDHTRFSSHMSNSSWMLGGGQMKIEVDEKKGQEVGSHIRLSGKVFGIPLFLDEVVTQRQPPNIKTWETVGDLKLLIIGHYKMSAIIQPLDDHSLLKVGIDYNLPSTNVWLGKLFSGMYAKWCVQQMIKGARLYNFF